MSTASTAAGVLLQQLQLMMLMLLFLLLLSADAEMCLYGGNNGTAKQMQLYAYCKRCLIESVSLSRVAAYQIITVVLLTPFHSRRKRIF